MTSKIDVRQFILTNYLQGERPENLTERDAPAVEWHPRLDGGPGCRDLRRTDVRCQFTAHETTADQLDSIGDLVRLVAGKRATITA